MTKPTVALFATCVNDTMFPGTPQATRTLLERLGCRVVFPKGVPPSRIWTLARETDTPLRRFQPVKSTLEELFLELLEKSDGN